MVLVFSDYSQAVDGQRVTGMTPHRKRPQKAAKKPSHPAWDERATCLPWFHPHFTRRMQSPARRALHSWPITDALRDSLPPMKAGRCRASGWYSLASLPEMALSRWPSVAVGKRLLLVPLYAITIRTAVSISRGEPAVKPVQQSLRMLHCYHLLSLQLSPSERAIFLVGIGWVYGARLRSNHGGWTSDT